MSSVPPGYKQTEVGVIPEEWEVKSLGDVVSFTNGKAHESCIKDFGKYLVVNSKFISTEGEVKKYSDEYFCPTALDDILMVMSDVPNGRAIAKCFRVDHENRYTVNQRICILRATSVDSNFLFFKINRHPFYLGFDDGVKQTNLRKEDVLACPIAAPKSLPEQRAIATALSDVDALIASLDKLIAKKRDMKQAAMQELLTGKRRLPGFSGEWEVKRLGDECEVVTKGTTPTSIGRAFINQGINFVKIESLTDDGNIILDKLAAIDFVTHNLLKRSQLKENDILFSIAGALGRTAIVKNDLLPANTNQALAIIRLKQQSLILHAFLFVYLKSPMITAHVDAINVQAAQANLSLEDIRSFKIQTPAAAEQTAIAAILSDMDTEIAALEQKRDKTRLLKQGMMQELLTGRIRLV